MIHLFKASDKSWVFSGTTKPANMESDDYVEGVLPEGETWDYEYNYTYVDSVATKGDKIDTSGFVEDNGYAEKRLNEYPNIAEQLDKIYHHGIDAWKADIKAIKDKHPKT